MTYFKRNEISAGTAIFRTIFCYDEKIQRENIIFLPNFNFFESCLKRLEVGISISFDKDIQYISSCCGYQGVLKI